MLNPLISCLLLLAPPDEAATRSEVESTLAQMQGAALAGDVGAYMANIAPDDANFLKEQENWAAQLVKYRPVELSMAIGAEPEGAFAPERATFPLVVRYRMDTGHAAVEGGKSASCPVVFTKDDPDGPGPEPARWFFRGEDWLVLTPDEPGFVVKYLPGSEQVAKDVAAAFPVAKAHVDEHFRIENHTPQQIKLYQNMEHLKAWVYLSMPDEVLGGWNEPGESIKFMVSYTRGVENWTGAFAHEYGHVATWEYGPAVTKMPWWVAEGAAEYSSDGCKPGYRERIDALIRGRAAAGTLVPWADISDYQTAAAPVKIMAYHQGHSMVTYITRKWGDDGRIAWLRAIAQGTSVDDATKQALGVSFDELDAQWRVSLTKLPPSDVPT